MTLRVFPVQSTPTSSPSFSDDWGAPRSGHTHQGTDIIAGMNSPLLAVDNGHVKFGTDTLGGNVANLYSDDGTRYYYAHMAKFVGEDRQVKAGDIIGTVGKTGNAVNSVPHVHFEVHPNNGPAVNPYPLLVAAPHVTMAAQSIAEATPGWVKITVIVAIGLGTGWFLVERVLPELSKKPRRIRR